MPLFKKTIRMSEYQRVFFNSSLTEPIDGISGATYNAQRKTILLVRNVSGGAGHTYEYDLNGKHLRTITHSNFVDTEALCWMYNDIYAIGEENPNNRITIVRIPDDATTVNRNNFTTTSFSTGLAYANLGIEGVAYDALRNCLYFITEKSSAGTSNSGTWPVWQMNISDGSKTALFDLVTVVGSAGIATDVSDMQYDSVSQLFYISSQESAKILVFTRNGVLVDQAPITGFTQIEGFGLSSSKDFMFVSSEVKEFGIFKLKNARQKNILCSKTSRGIKQGVLR